jgi:O-antigen/teichoic acid export membrane protein
MSDKPFFVNMRSLLLKNYEDMTKHLSTPLFKNAYFLMAGSALISMIGFVFLIVATRFYSIEAIGLTTAAISALGIIAIFSELGLGIGLIRFLPGSGKNGNDMLNACLTLSGLTSIVLALIFLSGLGVWSPALLLVLQDTMFSIAFVIFAMVTALNPLVLNVFLARRDTKFILISNVIASVFKLVLAILFAIFLNSAFGLFVSAGLAAAIALVISVILLLPKVQSGYRPRPIVKKEALNEIWRYSIGNYISRSLLQITPLILPLMVVNVLSIEMNAYFFVAWAIANMLMVIPSSISNSLFAEGSNNETSLKANTAKSLKLMLLLLLPSILFILIIADKLLLLFGQAYSDNSSLMLRIVLLSIFPYSINYLYISIARVTKNISCIIKVTTVLTSLSLGLSYFLMLNMGLIGVGIGYLAGQSIVAIAVVIFLWRDYKFSAKDNGHRGIS